MVTTLSADRRVERPRYVLLAVGLELFTALGAIPVGLALVRDSTGGSVGLPHAWIEATPFGSYLIPGLYLFAMNGLGMVVVAWLSIQRHRWAPWLTGILGTGLAIWIGVQLVVMLETSALQAIFGLIGLVLVAVSVAWLRRTGQARLW